MSENKIVIGIDYGTDSCRALAVDAASGEQLAEAVSMYGRWAKGLYCNPQSDCYRQHPEDHLLAFKDVIRNVVGILGKEQSSCIAAISFDTTASTPVIVNEKGIPLSLTEEFREEPDAMFMLWKDHTAIKEADDINSLAKSYKVDYTSFSGGSYSAEWAWAKVLHVLRTNPKVASAAYCWVEHCDWMSAWATGNIKPEKTMRSRCAAGHKGMWRAEWGGYPSEEFLNMLNPKLGEMRSRMSQDTYTADKCAGILRDDIATELGLPSGVKVGLGSIDAHVGAVGASISPNVLTKIIGTSTCDILVCDKSIIGDRQIKGICGQVDGSVLPGFIGLEAGQAAFGDIYAWFRKLLSWPLSRFVPEKEKEIFRNILPELESEAERIGPEDSSLICLDWFNGRRTPDPNLNLKGAIYGLTLGSDAPMVYRSLVEATAFGSRAILERFLSEGLKIDSVIAVGGIPQKSPFVMQILADVLGRTISVSKCSQSCALGAAMFASVAAGIHENTAAAQKAIGIRSFIDYIPNKNNNQIYNNIYSKYIAIGMSQEKDLQ
jgi:L-ribulokinase